MMTKKKIKIIFKALKKTVKPWQLIFIILLLSANTFAWFIYSREVSNSIDVHVRAWNIFFKNDDEEVINYIDFKVDSIYPGMEDHEESINIVNDGEVSATVSYKLLEIQILDENYITVEGRENRNEDPVSTDMSSDELETKLLRDYPFKINFSLDNANLEAFDGSSRYNFSVTWPYESGDDEADTLWGSNAYYYKTNNPGAPCIKIKAFVVIDQNKE